MPSVRKRAKPPCGKEAFSADVPASSSASPNETTLDPHLQVLSEPTPGLEPGTPSLRGKDE